MKRIHLYVYLIYVSFIGCNQAAIKEKHNQRILDTVKVASTSCVNRHEGMELLNSFNVRHGVAIPKYYLSKDSLPIDLNKDGLIDTLVVLSPIVLEDMEYSDFKIEEIPKRLLVEIINDNGNSRIGNIYSNLISDVGGVLSPYNGILSTDKGFAIIHEAGAKYSWTYTMEFAVTDNMLGLVKIIKECSFDGNSKKAEYDYKNLTLDAINIIDTLSHQCNCDVFWSELDK